MQVTPGRSALLGLRPAGGDVEHPDLPPVGVRYPQGRHSIGLDHFIEPHGRVDDGLRVRMAQEAVVWPRLAAGFVRTEAMPPDFLARSLQRDSGRGAASLPAANTGEPLT